MTGEACTPLTPPLRTAPAHMGHGNAVTRSSDLNLRFRPIILVTRTILTFFLEVTVVDQLYSLSLSFLSAGLLRHIYFRCGGVPKTRLGELSEQVYRYFSFPILFLVISIARG